MKTINYLTQKDLEEIPNSLRGFFEGKDCFFTRNGATQYVHSMTNISDLLKADNALDTYREDEYRALIDYIGKKREYYQERIEQAQKTIEDCGNSMIELNAIGSVITGKNTMKQNLINALGIEAVTV